MFLGLVALGTLPLAVALVVAALQTRATGSGARASLDEIAASGRTLIETLDTTALTPSARTALDHHAAAIARRTTQARIAEFVSRTWAGVITALILVVAVVTVVGSLTFARRWARYTSAPVEELVRWVRHIALREPLPTPTASASVAPEFDALRQALRDMSEALERARVQELENERLSAFRETARHVAHEMRGPLSAARLALGQVTDSATADGRAAAALKVLEDETNRLDRLAKEFAEFGRLPEGPQADVDIGELLAGVIAATVPADRTVSRDIEPRLLVRGHYEPLRRAFQNIVKNAVEAGGALRVSAFRSTGSVRVAVTDGGPGVPVDQRERIFDPYVTTKPAGTGLGLALVRQTVTAHRGTVEVEDGPAGGARFVVMLPDNS